MRPLLIAALVLVAGLGQTRAVPPAAYAVVRVPSHGASATVIETRPGASLLLGCAHAFAGPDRARPISLDVPMPPGKSEGPRRAVIRLVDIDERADLSLILLQDGPLPFVAPVAPPGHVPGRKVLSIGYDEMRWPARMIDTTILGSSPSISFTRERPGHGRSGGALLDVERGLLIGVVQGYEVAGQRRGLYVAHPAILRFLHKHQPQPRPSCPT